MNEEIQSLSAIFDSSLNMERLRVFPVSLVEESTNLKTKLQGIYNVINTGGFKSKLASINEAITPFISKSHKLLDDIFQNVRALSKALKSTKSKLTEISTYYLNNTPNSFHGIIEESQNLLANYYLDEEELIFSNVDSLINNFTENLTKSIKEEQSKIDNLLEKLEDEEIIYVIENESEDDKNLLITNLKDTKVIINSIIEKVEELIKGEMNIKENGHLTSDKDIKSMTDSYNTDITEGLETALLLDNDESIDKDFDKSYGEFRQNYTKLMINDRKKLEEQSPFLDNTLEDTLFSNKENLEKSVTNLGSQIIDSIKDENDDYLKKANAKIHDFLIKHNKTLNELMLNFTTVFSEDTLKELADSYELAFHSSFNKLNNDIENNQKLANDYFSLLADLFSDDNKIVNLLKTFETDAAHLPYYLYYWSRRHYVYFTKFTDYINKKSKTRVYLNKYNKYKEEMKLAKEYIKDILPMELKYEYKNVITKLKDLLQIIKGSKLNDKFTHFKELEFLENNIKQVDSLYQIINKYFSEQNFTEKYLPELNEYRPYTIEKIDNIEEKIIEPNHLIINQFETANDYNNDFCFAFLRKKVYTCTNGVIYNLESSSNYCEVIENSDNYKSLISLSIYTDTNIQKFMADFERFYSKLNVIVVTYTEIINELSSKLYTFESEAISTSKTTDYYIQLKNVVNDILSKKYGNDIILSTYTYFQEDLKGRANNVFNELITGWKELFNNVYTEVNKNKDKYKNSITEFGILSNIYYSYFSEDISEKYYDMIMAHQKNEFNNTIIYYYNYFIRLITEERQNIINSIPKNEIGFERVLEQRKNEVNDLFDELIQIIKNSQKNDLSEYNQLYLLQVPKTNFYNISYLLSNFQKNVEKNCQSIVNKIYSLDNGKVNDMYSYIARYYLENSENGRQNNEFFKEIDNNNFIYLKTDNFKTLLTNNWIFDEKNFIKSLNDTMTENNQEISNELATKIKGYRKNLEDEITKHNSFTKDNIRITINNLYKEAIKDLQQKEIATTAEDINEIVKKILFYLNKEKERLSETELSYYNDYTLINQTIKYYKQIIIDKINKKIIQFIEEFRNYLLETVYAEYYHHYLNDYIDKIKEGTKSIEDVQLLNSTYNIGSIIDQLAKELAEEYGDRAKTQINVKSNEYIENLQILLNLEKIQENINNQIDNSYSNLYENLKNKLIIDNTITGYIKYDLSDEIKEDLDNFIKEKYNIFANAIDSLKGEKYNNIDVKNYVEWDIPDFGKITNIIKPIKKSFDYFIESEKNDEEKKINNFVKQTIKTNFYELLNNLIPSFGNQFFQRIIAYNENFRLNNLFDNLKWALHESIFYVETIELFFNINQITKDLEIKILRMNDLETKILENNIKILNKLEQKANDFILDSENYILEKYRLFIINDPDIEISFEEKVKKIIRRVFTLSMDEVKVEYEEMIKVYLKDKLFSS